MPYHSTVLLCVVGWWLVSTCVLTLWLCVVSSSVCKSGAVADGCSPSLFVNATPTAVSVPVTDRRVVPVLWRRWIDVEPRHCADPAVLCHRTVVRGPDACVGGHAGCLHSGVRHRRVLVRRRLCGTRLQRCLCDLVLSVLVFLIFLSLLFPSASLEFVCVCVPIADNKHSLAIARYQQRPHTSAPVILVGARSTSPVQQIVRCSTWRATGSLPFVGRISGI